MSRPAFTSHVVNLLDDCVCSLSQQCKAIVTVYESRASGSSIQLSLSTSRSERSLANCRRSIEFDQFVKHINSNVTWEVVVQVSACSINKLRKALASNRTFSASFIELNRNLLQRFRLPYPCKLTSAPTNVCIHTTLGLTSCRGSTESWSFL